MAVISQGITLLYSTSGSTYLQLTNLQEIPDLGGETESIEITTLGDAAHVYTDGLKNYGDSLAFKFLYETSQFSVLNELPKDVNWRVELPDGTTCDFTGASSVKLDGVGVGAALTYTLSIKPSTEMIWA